MASIALVGRGIVGSRIARRLPSVIAGAGVVDVDPRRPVIPADIQVALFAQAGPHAPLAERFLGAGISVISMAADLDDVRALCDLDDHADRNGATMVAGAGMSPGLTGLMARLLASQLASLDEIHVAVHGTAGPACAREQHRALRGRSVGLRDGEWIQPPAGSGRELCYFPEPVGPYDCYRAEFATPILMHRVFPAATRISERVSANRRDRLTAWLPMLTPPHREGGTGAARVEVRGTDERGGRATLICGVAELVATAAAATTIAFASHAVQERLPTGLVCAGDDGLDTVDLLHLVERAGVRLQEFTGVASDQRISANI
jgi:hypothetical protein